MSLSSGSGSHCAIILGLRSNSARSARWSLRTVPSDRGMDGGGGVPSSWVAGVLVGMGC